MKLPRLASVAAALIMTTGIATAAKKPGLEPFADSYTGTAFASAGAVTLAGSSTLTFTGKKSTPRGTFLYNGILNAGGVAQQVAQTFNLSSRGVISGRANIGDASATGSGTVKLTKKTLNFSILYTFEAPATGTILLTGKVVFQGKRATLTAQVAGSDPAFNGTLLVKGKR